MTALLRSEWLKLRTTRGWYGYLAVLVLFTGIGAAGTVGSAEDEYQGTLDLRLDLVEVAGVGSLLVLLLGITAVTTEFRHGTITPTLLAAPWRERVLAAKAVTTSLAGLLFVALGLLVVAAVALPWLAALDVELALGDGELWKRVAQTFLAAVLWALVGAAVGSLVHAQVAALVGTLLWLFVGETLVSGLLGWLDVDGLARYLPFQALDAADGSRNEDLLSYEAGIAVSLAWVAVLGAAGVLRTRRRDIT